MCQLFHESSRVSNAEIWELCLNYSFLEGRIVYSFIVHVCCAKLLQFSSAQSLNCVRLFVTPWIVAHQASLLSCPPSWWCHPAILSSVVPFSSIPQSLPASGSFPILCMRWPKCWSFSFSISPSSEHPGLLSFRMDWLDLLAVQGTLKSLLQHHSSKASIFQHSAFFTVQLSHRYMTTGKTIALTRRT